MDDLVQDFFIRPEGNTFDLDVYESYTNLFTIKCHYYGKFNDGLKKEYIKGDTCFVDLVNRDQFTDVVLNTVINSLGYEMEDEVLYWYKIPLKSLDVGLKPLVSESDYRRFLGYVKKHKVMDVYVEIVEKNEESESGSDSASESDNDFEDEEHVVQEVEVNMGYFNFQVEDASTGTDGNMIPVAPKVNLTEDNIEVLEFDSLESDLEDVPENDRRDLESGRELLGLDGAFHERTLSRTKVTAVGDYYKHLKSMFPHAEHRLSIRKAYEWLKQKRFRLNIGAGQHLWSSTDMLLEARDSPIITALEHVREYLMKRIVVIQKIIEKCDGPLTPAVARVFDIIKEASSECIVDWNGADQYQVKGYLQNNNGNDVCILMIGIHDSLQTCNMEGMFIPQGINPVNVGNLWSKFDCQQPLLHKNPPQIGRPPKKRKKIKGEIVMIKGNKLTRQGKTITCSLCHAAGHKKEVVIEDNLHQASQGGTSNAAGTKRKSKGSTGTSNAAMNISFTRLQRWNKNAGTQASIGPPLKRTKKSASRLTPEK
ncbi:hypothetical protein Tco_0506588 [Tanacetum coccineum]